jgi:hypothetical protein
VSTCVFISGSHALDDPIPMEEDGREGLKFMGFALAEDNGDETERYDMVYVLNDYLT